jgi:hypothetical protein
MSFDIDVNQESALNLLEDDKEAEHEAAHLSPIKGHKRLTSSVHLFFSLKTTT